MPSFTKEFNASFAEIRELKVYRSPKETLGDNPTQKMIQETSLLYIGARRRLRYYQTKNSIINIIKSN